MPKPPPSQYARILAEDRGEAYVPPPEGVSLEIESSPRRMASSPRYITTAEDALALLQNGKDDLDPELLRVTEEEEQEVAEELAEVQRKPTAPSIPTDVDMINLTQGALLMEGRVVELQKAELDKIMRVAISAFERALNEEAKRIRRDRLGAKMPALRRKGVAVSKSGRRGPAPLRKAQGKKPARKNTVAGEDQTNSPMHEVRGEE